MQGTYLKEYPGFEDALAQYHQALGDYNEALHRLRMAKCRVMMAGHKECTSESQRRAEQEAEDQAFMEKMQKQETNE